MSPGILPAAIVGSLLVGSLVGCAPEDRRNAPPLAPAPTPSASTDEGSGSTAEDEAQVRLVGDPTIVASGLEAPWSIAVLDEGGFLISERDTAAVKHVADAGATTVIGTVPGVVPGGEGGLLGIALFDDPGDSTRWLYAYLTAASDNRIVRMPLVASEGTFTLGEPTVIFSGIAKAGNHNGGRIAFGPDGNLYATVGDAGVTERSQDPGSPNGKILRLTPTGGFPSDNPFPASPVYSLGHRNPQGIAWDATGTLWAAEFGQNTWDEVNRITAGANYGWPQVEGRAGESGFTDPVYQWAPSEASPSGLTRIGGSLILAALRGNRVWVAATADGGDPIAYLEGTYGRIRDVAPGPDGSLMLLTNNTDGRGTPQDGDDLLVRVELAPLVVE